MTPFAKSVRNFPLKLELDQPETSKSYTLKLNSQSIALS